MNHDDLTVVGNLLDKLYRAYRRSDLYDGGRDVAVSIPLALALIRRLSQDDGADGVRHVVVLGPTQAGKSTVVNLLLRANQAQVSPLAGFTRALAGFAVDLSAAQLESVQRYLQRAARRDVHQLVEVQGPALGATAVVVWDTPDFDSVSSREYRVDIADAVALADLIVLVVSREKYADLSVWKMLDLVHPLQPPMILCLNKTSDDASALTDSLRQRVSESRYQGAQIEICMLPYAPAADAALDRAGEALRAVVNQRLIAVGRSQRVQGLRRLLAEHWQSWLAPAREEIAQAETWNETVDDAGKGIRDAYRGRYLDDARYYTSFNQAVVRLLELLEIPGLAGPLAKARQLLTWPVRKLFGVGEPGSAGSPRQDMEVAVLTEAFEHALLSLRQRLNEQVVNRDQRAVRATVLNRVLTTEEAAMRERFTLEVDRYQRDFESEIAAAAQSLYAELEQRPAVLNGLRAARVSADAAGVLLAVKTGAVGVNEAVLTPAMLSLTSLLTESAVGKYVDTVKDDLKRRQDQHVSKLLRDSFSAPLKNLSSQLDDDRLFAIGADEIECAQRSCAVS